MGILIIEDDKRIANLIKRRLETEQYKAAVAYDGEKGFKKALSPLITLHINPYGRFELDMEVGSVCWY